MFQPIRVKTSCCDKECSCGDAGITSQGFAELVAKVDGKQDELTAGEGISIEDNVISALAGKGKAEIVEFTHSGAINRITDLKPGIYFYSNSTYIDESGFHAETRSFIFVVTERDISLNNKVYSNCAINRASSTQFQDSLPYVASMEISNHTDAEIRVIYLDWTGHSSNGGVGDRDFIYRLNLEESE